MHRDTPALEEDLHRRLGEPRLDAGVHEGRRHAVEVVIDLDVVINIDATRLPLGEPVTCPRQRQEAGRSSCVKNARRLTRVRRVGRSLIASSCSTIAAFRSASVKSVRWRRTARIQRWAICTLTSTLGLSVGVATRAGMTTAP